MNFKSSHKRLIEQTLNKITKVEYEIKDDEREIKRLKDKIKRQKKQLSVLNATLADRMRK